MTYEHPSLRNAKTSPRSWLSQATNFRSWTKAAGAAT
jgi:hypothetical protein